MRFLGLCAVVSLLCASQASAQSATQSVPFDRLATNVVAVALPAQWKVSAFAVDRFVVEQGEVIPQDQSRAYWRDQLGYIAAPNTVQATATDAAGQTAEGCAASLTLHVAPRGAGADEDWAEVLCLTSWRASDAIPQAPLEVLVFNSKIVGDGSFVFWRAWRGLLGEAVEMFARHRQRVTPLPGTPSSADFEAWRAAMPRIVEDFAAQMRNAFPVCNLAEARPCAPLHVAAAHKPANAIAVVSVAGSVPGAPTSDHDAPADTLDFTKSEVASSLAQAIETARQGGGGIVSLSGPSADPAQIARQRAYLLRIGRQRVSAGVAPPEALAFDLWPNAR